jgi:tight adherence protein C
MQFNPFDNFEQLLRQPLTFTVLLFAAVSLLSWAIFGVLVRRYDNPLRQRLLSRGRTDLVETPMARARADAGPQNKVAGLVDRVTKAAAKPLMPKEREEQSKLRKRLGHAGLYGANAMQLFVGCRILGLLIGAAGGVLLGISSGNAILGGWLACMLALVGLMLPNLWLSHRVKRRQLELQSALPDALDLMVVCVEAGLTVDAALQRVGQEIELAHPEISRELAMTHMETRIGVARADALRNLGRRTGCASLQSLAAMLVQAERFGTSIGTALRVHADSLRVKRQHDAEERAAKTTVKLAFPVVLFIFPTVIAVLGGPAFILFYKSPIFHGGGN